MQEAISGQNKGVEVKPANRKVRVGLLGLFTMALVLAGVGPLGGGVGVVPAPKVKLVDTFQTATRSEAGSLVHAPSNSNMVYGCIDNGYCGSDPGTAFLTNDNTTGVALQTFCMDFDLIINYQANAYHDNGNLFGTPGTANPQGNASNPSQIAYIITHYAPADNHLPEPYGDIVEEAAVQAAIWHFSQGFYFSTAGGGQTDGMVITRYNQIVRDANSHAGYVQPGIVGIDPNPNPAVNGVTPTPVPTIDIPNDTTPGQSNFNVYYDNAMHGVALATGGGTDFSSTNGLQLNGNTVQSGNTLQLTSDVQGESGNAWATTKLDLTKSFSTNFEFELYGGDQADGITFALQNSPQGKNAQGTGGQDLGFWGGGISPAAGVEFDTFANGGCDSNNNHMAFIVDTTTCDISLYTPSFSIWNAGPVPTYATINYNASTHVLSAGVSQSPGAPVNIFENINLASTVGPSAYIGFTGATGGNDEFNDILNWSMNSVGYDGFGSTANGPNTPGAMSGKIQVSLDSLGTSDAHFCPGTYDAQIGTGPVTKIEDSITGSRQVSVCATTTNDAAPIVSNAASTPVTMHAALCGSNGTLCADTSIKDKLTEGYEMVSGSPGQYQRLINAVMVPINTEPDPITGTSTITVIGHVVPSNSQTVTDCTTGSTMTATNNQLTGLAVHPGDNLMFTVNYANSGSEDAPGTSKISTNVGSTVASDNMGLLSNFSYGKASLTCPTGPTGTVAGTTPAPLPSETWPVGAVSHATGGSVNLFGTVPTDLPTGTINQPSTLICNRPDWSGTGLITSSLPAACVEVVPVLNVALTQAVIVDGASAPGTAPSCAGQTQQSVNGQPNNWVTYCYTLTNTGDTPITGVSVYDPLPVTNGLTYSTLVLNGPVVGTNGASGDTQIKTTGADGSQRVEWNNLLLPANSSVTTELTGQLAGPGGSGSGNCSASGSDTNLDVLWAPGIILLDSNQATVSFTTGAQGLIDTVSSTYSVTPNTVHLNEPFAYTVTIANSASSGDAITNLYLIFQPPADVAGSPFAVTEIDQGTGPGTAYTQDTSGGTPPVGQYTEVAGTGNSPPTYTIALDPSPGTSLAIGTSQNVYIQMFPPTGATAGTSVEPTQLRTNSVSPPFTDPEGDPTGFTPPNCGVAPFDFLHAASGNPGNVRLEK